MAIFKGLIKSCEVCGAEFKVPQSQAHVRTCSRECGYQIRKSANKVEHVKLECKHCKKIFTDHPSHAGKRVYCSRDCMFSNPDFLAARSESRSGDGNPMWKGGVTRRVVSKNGVEYTRTDRESEREKDLRRRMQVERATPRWADKAAISAIYRYARAYSESTGIQHDVDHIIPINSELVCGLHVPANLQVLTSEANRLKGSNFSPH